MTRDGETVDEIGGCFPVIESLYFGNSLKMDEMGGIFWRVNARVIPDDDVVLEEVFSHLLDATKQH